MLIGRRCPGPLRGRPGALGTIFVILIVLGLMVGGMRLGIMALKKAEEVASDVGTRRLNSALEFYKNLGGDYTVLEGNNDLPHHRKVIAVLSSGVSAGGLELPVCSFQNLKVEFIASEGSGKQFLFTAYKDPENATRIETLEKLYGQLTLAQEQLSEQAEADGNLAADEAALVENIKNWHKQAEDSLKPSVRDMIAAENQ